MITQDLPELLLVQCYFAQYTMDKNNQDAAQARAQAQDASSVGHKHGYL